MAKIRVPSDQRNEQTVKHLPEIGDQTSGSSQTRPAGFPTTHWSGVLATAATETTHAREALGRFRSFLLKSLNHFLTDEWRRARAQKRGGGQVVSLDAATAETRYGLELADPLTPELLYDRLWAVTLLASVFRSLQDEYGRDGKADLFQELKFCLTGSRSAIPYTDLAQRLGVPPNTVKTWVHRLRQRYRQLLREEVGRTLASPDDIEPELQCLFKALG
jgi:RNA polymerase sigma-70 factor (ECF subfamily)